MSAVFCLLPCSIAGSPFGSVVGPLAWMGGMLGYVGPGAGLSMLGALMAVIFVILLALLAPILLPIRLLRSVLRRRRERRESRRAGFRLEEVEVSKSDAAAPCAIATEAAPDEYGSSV